MISLDLAPLHHVKDHRYVIIIVHPTQVKDETKLKIAFEIQPPLTNMMENRKIASWRFQKGFGPIMSKIIAM